MNVELAKPKYSISDSKRVSITAIMTALALVGNYSLVTIPNVELGSVILFITAYIFGAQMAVTSTLIMTIVYGSINPWGAFIPEIWLAQVIGWFFMIAAGVIIGHKGPGLKQHPHSMVTLGAIGAFLTLYFDLLTSLAYSVVFQMPYVLALLWGIPFFLVHIVSNTILFAYAIPSLEPTLRSQFASQIWDFDDAIESEE
ncbi:MAG: hypothetical protein ACTSUO_06695 [Candidatus Thorarchaeota archaeon]